ncbi:MAG: ABC transporter ATP-binding protein [Burkholderiales bacterium]|nr:ABC transporter ATP-binding protein [Burkholderiales bacterium]
MSENIIELKNVSFAYNENKQILTDISMKIPYGKIVAIMGGSGCGKTTVLKLISGQIKANSGKITAFGTDITRANNKTLEQIRTKLGMLFQFGALFTDLSVYDNIAFPLNEHTKLNKTLKDIIVAMKLESVGLSGTQELFPSELSGGMARRIALARAMALDPELMMYDEPFTGLDPISLNTIAMLIKKLNDNLKQTTILVTHDIPITMKIADYIYFMSNGKVIAEGTPKEISVTENKSVQQFINGEVNGPFAYKYNSNKSYDYYLGRESI